MLCSKIFNWQEIALCEQNRFFLSSNHEDGIHRYGNVYVNIIQFWRVNENLSKIHNKCLDKGS